jgi:hypothetical protein
MKPATKKMDARIWKLWKDGEAPKDIKAKLELSSTWVVYHALKRERKRQKISAPKRAKTRQRPKKRSRVN